MSTLRPLFFPHAIATRVREGTMHYLIGAIGVSIAPMIMETLSAFLDWVELAVEIS